jgi:hypothetical protein
MKIVDKFYPTIGIDARANIVEVDTGFRWKIEMHVAGPDDLLVRESAIYPSKHECTVNLLQRYPEVIKELFEELNT